jgi:hypothetical protein
MTVSRSAGGLRSGPLARASVVAFAVAFGSLVVPGVGASASASPGAAAVGPAAAAAPETGRTLMGWSTSGFIGDGSAGSLTPVRISGLRGRIKQVSGGLTHSLAVLTDGTVWAWGENDFGQLGDGTTVDRRTPVQVPGLTNITQVDAGTSFSLALRSDGTVLSWGANQSGQLGNGTVGNDRTGQLSPGPVSGLTDVKQISGNGIPIFEQPFTSDTAPGANIASVFERTWGHSVALRNDGTVWAWGYNGWGQLGDPRLVFPAPVQKVPNMVPGLTGVAQVETGQDFTVARLTDGTVKSWGANYNGQLGINNTVRQRDEPTPVPGLSGVAQLSSMYEHSLALLSDGTVRAWGSNFNGEIGDGTSGVHRFGPVPVSGLSGVTEVAAGIVMSMARLANGTARAWGSNSGGKLGDGTTQGRLTPVPVSGLTGATQLSTSGIGSHALVEEPGFTVALVPASGSVVAGDTLNTPLIVTGVNGFTGSATLSAAGLPAGVTFSPGEASTGGPTTATFTTSRSTPPGTYQITVTATNTTVFDPVKTATFALTVNPPPGFTVALSQPSGTVAVGRTITTSVNLTPISGFTGSARLAVSGLPAGVNAALSPGQVSAARSATLTLSTLSSAPIGTFTVTVTATNTTVFEPVKTVTYQLTTVQAQGFTLGLSPAAGTVSAGTSTLTTVNLTAVNGFPGAATLTIGTLPAGVTASFSAGQVSAANPATLTLSTTTSAPPGTYQVTVTGTNNSVPEPVKIVNYQLTITPAPDFTIALSQQSASIAPGDSIAMSVSLDPLNTFPGGATLTAPNLPTGVTAEFSPGQVSPGNPATLTLSTEFDTAPGTVDVVVTATKDGVVRTATFVLTINGGAAPPEQP